MKRYTQIIVIIAILLHSMNVSAGIRSDFQQIYGTCMNSINLFTFSAWNAGWDEIPSGYAQCIGEAYLGSLFKTTNSSYEHLVKGSEHSWLPHYGRVTVHDYYILAEFKFDQEAIDFFKTTFADSGHRFPIGLEIDIVALDDVFLKMGGVYGIGGKEGHTLEDAGLFKDTTAFDENEGYGAVIRYPHKLEADIVYGIIFYAKNASWLLPWEAGSLIKSSGKAKLNIQVSVDYAWADSMIDNYDAGNHTLSGFGSEEGNQGGGFRYFVVSTDGFDSISVSPGNSSSICWTAKKGNDVGCVQGNPFSLNSVESNNGALTQEDFDSGKVFSAIGTSEIPFHGRPTPGQEVATPNLPDFITNRLWLTTTSGIETYTYDASQEISMNALFANIGSKACNGKDKIKVHFYLSQGYKEDSHDKWKRVGTDEIRCDNLKPESNATKLEVEGLKPWEYGLNAGIYNIVACIDHPKDDHNNGGDYPEEHESNNCSTEAVFNINNPANDPTETNSDCLNGSTSLTCESNAAAIIPIITDLLLADPELTINIEGKGIVTSTPSGIKCPGTCVKDFSDQKVTLTAKPKKGSVFVGWSEGCGLSKRKNVCKLDITEDRSITATFKKQ